MLIKTSLQLMRKKFLRKNSYPPFPPPTLSFRLHFHPHLSSPFMIHFPSWMTCALTSFFSFRVIRKQNRTLRSSRRFKIRTKRCVCSNQYMWVRDKLFSLSLSLSRFFLLSHSFSLKCKYWVVAWMYQFCEYVKREKERKSKVKERREK